MRVGGLLSAGFAMAGDMTSLIANAASVFNAMAADTKTAQHAWHKDLLR